MIAQKAKEEEEALSVKQQEAQRLKEEDAIKMANEESKADMNNKGNTQKVTHNHSTT